VDLAGSERVANISLKDSLYTEAVFINESLKYLGFLVRWLAADRPHTDLDFSLNLMTSLITDSLGGKSRTMMFVCISPSFEDREATFDSLRFAAETGKIANRPGALTDTKYEFLTSRMYAPF
jgi:kinesin family protein C2/C3